MCGTKKSVSSQSVNIVQHLAAKMHDVSLKSCWRPNQTIEKKNGEFLSKMIANVALGLLDV